MGNNVDKSTPQTTSAKKNYTAIILAVTAIVVVACYLFFTGSFSSKSAFDTPTKDNPKMVAMFDKQLRVNIDNYEQNSIHPDYLSTAKTHVDGYLKTIKKIESYSRYGVSSSRAKNAIEVRLTFANGSVAESLYTGKMSSHMMPPPLLMSVLLDDGKTVSVLTNGVEKSGSPEWVIPELNAVIQTAIGYEVKQNRGAYYPAAKTKSDFEKEWEDQ